MNINKQSIENKTCAHYFQWIQVICFIAMLFSFGNAYAQYCTPGTVSGCVANDQYTNFSLTGGFTNISHNPGTTCVGNSTGYASFIGCGLTERASIGTTIDFSITNTPTYQEGYAIWIDWNQNNTFETSEEVYASTSVLSGSETVTGSFIVPTVAVSGRTKLRIRCLFNMAGTTIDPCSSGSYDYGISFDFPFYVTSIPPATLPVFTGGNMQSVAYCSTGTANSINTLMQVYDTSHSYSLTWSQSVAPLHGTLNATYSATSTGGNSTPTGLTYTPNTGYIGQDSFIATVNDGNCGIAATNVQITVNPLPTINTLSNQVICSGITSTKIVFTGSLSGTSYSWVNNNTSIGLTGLGTDSVMPFTAINASAFADSATIVITPTNINGCTGNLDSFKLIVNPKPNVTTPTNQTICNGLSSTTLRFTSNVAGTAYTWVNSDTAIGLTANGADSIAAFNVIDTTNIIDTAIITVVPTANSCVGIEKTFKIIVNPTPKVNSIANQAKCNGLTISTINFLGPVSNTSFLWSNSDTTIGIPSTGLDSIGSFIVSNTTSLIDTAKITVTPSANGCTGIAKHFDIIVFPTPNVILPTNQMVCNGSLTSAVNFSGTVSGTSFNWTNTDTTIGLSGAGTLSISSFTAKDSTNLIDTATIVVLPYANGCLGMADSFKIIVYPTPKVATVSNKTYCNGTLASIIFFNGPVVGTSFTWTNSDTLIGFSATGNDYISAFTATDTSNVIDTSTIVITPSANGCVGINDSFKIIVYPTPNVSVPASQTLCNGMASTIVNFTSTVTGTTFAWTNSDTLIGLSASGIDSIASFSSIDTSSIIDTALIAVMPTANGCVGFTQNFKIIVNPTPKVTQPLNVTVCSGLAIPTIHFTGNVLGTTFAWTNSDTLIGLSATGIDSIHSFTSIDTSHIIDTATIMVTPTANGCSGVPKSFKIIVFPTPNTNTPANQILCNGVLSTVVNFTGTVNGTTYTWTNNDTLIGLANSGIDSIAKFHAIDTGSIIDTATIVITPLANGCIGNTKNFMIIVNPTPNVTLPANQSICNGAATSIIAFNGMVDGTVFTWTNTDTTIGITLLGNGNIASFTGINIKTDSVVDTIQVIPTANGCSGTMKRMMITVYPTPKLISNLADTICSESLLTYLPNSATNGVNYSWQHDSVGHITPTKWSGVNAIYEALFNDTLGVVNVTYTYTLTANGCSNIENVVISVNPTPQLPSISIHPPSNLCANTLYQNFGAANAPLVGEQYLWGALNASVWATGNTHQYAVVNFKNEGTSFVTLTANVAGVGCYKTDSFKVNVGASVSDTAQVIFYNNNFICLLNSQDSYQWGYDDKLSLDSTIISGETYQSYYNPTANFILNDYWVITTLGSCMQKTYLTTPNKVENIVLDNDDKIKVYPNPAEGEVEVEIVGNNNSYSEIKMFDLLGKIVKTATITNNKSTFNVAELLPGVYLLSCYSNDRKVTTIRFIKN